MKQKRTLPQLIIGKLRKPCRQGVAEARKAKFIGINERIRVRRNAVYGVSGACLLLLCLLQPLSLSAENVRIDILSINDFHGALLEEGKNPGAAKLAGFMKELRGKNPKGTVILSGGDMFQGTARSNILYGKPVAAMMNNIKFDAMSLGNHEFDWGMDVLRARQKEAKFPMLSANVTDKATGKTIDFVLPYVVVKIKGVKVGIIGLTTPETAYTTNISVASKFDFADPAETVRKIYGSVKNAGADIVVIVGHLGSSQDGGTAKGEAVDLINALNGSDYRIDAVISAHKHNVVKDKAHGVPVVQAGSNGRNVGVITLYYSTDEKRVTESSVNVLPVPTKQAADRKVKKIVDRSAEKALPIENAVIGSTEGLDHDRHTISPLGMWAADAMKEAVSVDIAVQNGGGLRKPLAPGRVTLGSFYDIEPFDNTIVTMEMTGGQIRELLEYGLDNDYGVLQYSGLNIVYDPSGAKGAKIASITLSGGKPLLADGVYTICTNDFLADGGDGFVFFKQGKNIKNTNIVMRSILIDAVKKAGNVIFTDDGRFEKTAAQEKIAA